MDRKIISIIAASFVLVSVLPSSAAAYQNVQSCAITGTTRIDDRSSLNSKRIYVTASTNIMRNYFCRTIPPQTMSVSYKLSLLSR